MSADPFKTLRDRQLEFQAEPVVLVDPATGEAGAIRLSGRSVIGDEVVALDGNIQQLASIPAAAIMAVVSVETDADHGVRIRMNEGDPTTIGIFKPTGDEFVIGFDNEQLAGFRFIRTGGTGGQLVVWYY